MADIRLTDAEREALARVMMDWLASDRADGAGDLGAGQDTANLVTAALSAVPRLALASPMVGEAGLALLVTRRKRVVAHERLRYSAMTLKRTAQDDEHLALMENHADIREAELVAERRFDDAALTGEEATDGK